MGKKQKKKAAEKNKAFEFHPHFALDFVETHKLPLPDSGPTMSSESLPLKLYRVSKEPMDRKGSR